MCKIKIRMGLVWLSGKKWIFKLLIEEVWLSPWIFLATITTQLTRQIFFTFAAILYGYIFVVINMLKREHTKCRYKSWNDEEYKREGCNLRYFATRESSHAVSRTPARRYGNIRQEKSNLYQYCGRVRYKFRYDSRCACPHEVVKPGLNCCLSHELHGHESQTWVLYQSIHGEFSLLLWGRHGFNNPRSKTCPANVTLCWKRDRRACQSCYSCCTT